MNDIVYIKSVLKKGQRLIAKYSNSYTNNLKPVSKGNIFITFIDYDKVPSFDYLRAAYINALMSFAEKRNTARNFGVEFMLFAAMTDQISEAIEKIAPKPGRPFVVVTNSVKLLKDAEKQCKLSELKPKSKGLDIAELLKKMSMSRLQQ
jgi:tRNA threonylcarbamoyladenosine modification (KEOPS) complex Cgi121 subunit